jgi:pimeloyl-ACP methyl ester carboxylesterase
MTKTIRRAAALLSALALTALAVSPATATSTGTAAPTGGVSWYACGAGADARQRCGTLRVPLDYAHPGGPAIDLAVSRLASADPAKRRGVLVLVPGGPGNSGVNTPTSWGARLPAAVRDAYDLVGFDPRGTGASSPVSCGLSHPELAATRFQSWPAPDGDISGNAANARTLAAKCLANGGPVLRSISTRNEARDIDSIRRALGERSVSLWGVSYGTYVSAVYATLFGGHADRVLLDSSDDPDPRLVERRWLANYQLGVVDRFPDFARWAGDPANPDRVADTPDAVYGTFLALAARLDRDPLPWPGANPPELNGNVLRSTLLSTVYSDRNFAGLARLVLAARAGGPLPTAPSVPDAAMQQVIAVAGATICNDVAWPRDLRYYQRAVAVSRRRYPLTAGMPASIGPCSFWSAPAERPVAVHADRRTTVLLIQNLRDPATPYSGALNMERALGDRARMVSVDSGGHEAYLANGNACGDAAATDFLLTGHRAARDTRCPAA